MHKQYSDDITDSLAIYIRHLNYIIFISSMINFIMKLAIILIC